MATGVKLMALYKQPVDVDVFEKAYFGQHIPETKKMPGLRRLEIAKVTGAPRGEAAYYLAASLYFDDATAMSEALASEAGRRSAETLRGLGADVTMVFADVDEMDV